MIRTGEAWNDEDVALLRLLVQHGLGLPMIARRLERSQSAVRTRAARLRLSMKPQ
jgi:hypothetical protein